MKKYVELKTGDIILFTKNSGTGSFTTVADKGTYFMPAKKETRLNGTKIPINKNEPFIFTGSKLLYVKGKHRIIRIELTRIKTKQTCYVSEYNMHKYFSRPENQLSYITSCL